jgi:iron(III) transport system ATP-binding protein
MAEVALTKLRKDFGSAVAVADIDLSISSGELITLLGPSGCGKTTTLRMLAGLEEPTSGEIRIGDQTVFGVGRNVSPERRHIGMVFQSYAVWPHMTVAQNVGYPLKVRGVSRNEATQRVRDALAIVQLDPYADRYPSQLSGGQQQRVALARALIFEPSILLLDEPLSNLDAQLRAELRVEIRALQQKTGITALFVTHDQEEAFALSDRIGVMRNGNIIQLDEPEAVFERPADRFVAEFVGWKNFLPATATTKGAFQVGDRRVSALSSSSWREGDTVVLSARPEDIDVVDERAEGAFAATVRSCAYMGGHSAVDVDVGGSRMLFHDVERRRFSPGTCLHLKLDPSRTLAFTA